MSRSRSRRSISRVNGIATGPKPVQTVGSPTTPAIVSSARWPTAISIAWSSAVQAPGDPSNASRTRWICARLAASRDRTTNDFGEHGDHLSGEGRRCQLTV